MKRYIYKIFRNGKDWLPEFLFGDEKKAWQWLTRDEAYGLERDIFPTKKELLKDGWTVEPHELVKADLRGLVAGEAPLVNTAKDWYQRLKVLTEDNNYCVMLTPSDTRKLADVFIQTFEKAK